MIVGKPDASGLKAIQDPSRQAGGVGCRYRTPQKILRPPVATANEREVLFSLLSAFLGDRQRALLSRTNVQPSGQHQQELHPVQAELAADSPPLVILATTASAISTGSITAWVLPP